MSQLLQFYRNFQQSRQPVVKAQPTFEDLTIDDHLTEHQRVVRYVKSTIGLQRLVHVKMLSDVAKSVGFNETVATIIPLIGPLSKDVAPVVKQHLVEQLKTLAEFCLTSGGEAGYKIILDQLLPITAELLEDEKVEVRQSASLTLVEIAKLIKNDDIGQYVLTIILKLSHEDDKEEMRMTASSLLNLLAESMGQDLCKQFIIPEVVSLAEDPVFRVRKSTALNFHNICKVGGEHELLERLMPAFVRLSKDDIYRVRRACAESLSEISKNVGEDIRLGVLVEIFLRLTQDPSKLVKQSILQQSGMFIATLPTRAVTETILSHYTSMAYGPTGDLSVDAELKHICAYSFPAVLQIIGKNRWKDVRALYHNLAQSRSLNIKQTLSYSLHEIARILDDEKLVEEELVPVFEEMIQDQEAVQMGVIKHLASFLRFLPEPCRVSFLPPLHDILHSTNPFNWRLRQNLAVQLPELCELPPRNELFRTMFPLVMILLQDPVSCVRRDSFKGVTSLINALHGAIEQSQPGETLYQQQLDEVARTINSLIEGEKYQLRQLWVELCHQLLRDVPQPLFERYFVRGILQLTSDKVCNIRVALSYFLVDWDPACASPWEEGTPEKPTTPWHWLLRRPDIVQCIERLSQDDNDIYLNLVKLQKLFPNVTFASVKCRGRRTPPGGVEPVTMNPLPLEYEDMPPNEEICKLRSASEDGHFAPTSIGDAHAAQHPHRHSLTLHEEETHILRPIGVDMSSVDINVLLPRVRASSFPKMDEEFPGEGTAGAGFDDELDIIDGLGAFPKQAHVSTPHEGAAPVIHRSSADDDADCDLSDNVKPAEEGGDVTASAAAGAMAALKAASEVDTVELVDATSPNAFSSPVEESQDS